MKICRCVLLLLLWMCWGFVLPVTGHTADTDRQVLNSLLTELEQRIAKADERMVAHPKFLDELRAMVKQYRAKLRVVFFSDDFSDGDYRYSPAWVVIRKGDGKGTFFLSELKCRGSGLAF